MRWSQVKPPRPPVLLVLTAMALSGAWFAVALAAPCSGFRPTRHDMRGVPPMIARPIAAMPGDFNNDGIADIAVVNKFIDGFLQDGSISIMTGTSDGNLTLSSTQIIEGFSQWAVTGDFNEDDAPDVAAVTIDSALIFLGSGQGTFLPQVRIPMLYDPIHVSAADMNDDMHLDLVVVQQWISSATGRVTVLLGDGTGAFTLKTPSPVGQDPRAGVVADFNNDGKLDVVTGNNLSSNMSFLPGLGNGDFGPAVTSALGASGGFPAAADFNGDGLLDVVMTSETIAKPAQTMYGVGDGSFVPNATLQAGDTPRNPLLCDFDHDGKLDIAVPNAGSGDVSLMFGDGAGGFAAPVMIGTDGGPSQASVNDLNNDGFCDLVTANEGNNSISVLLGGPRGSLGTPTVNVGRAPLDVSSADTNRDGHVDLAVANRDDNTVTFFRGDGEGGFAQSQALSVGVNPYALASADFDLDGWPDFVVANGGVPGNIQNDTIEILRNDTAGGFTVQTSLTVGDVPLDVETADFDNDGRPDIAVANSQSDKISFYFGVIGGGFGNVKNVRIGDGQRWLAVADLNGDGFKDVAAALFNQNAILPVLGTPQGGFQTGTPINLGGPYLITRVAAGDLTGDGVADLVAVSQASDLFSPGQIAVLVGNGDATYTEPHPRQPTGIDPEGLAVLDLDRASGLDVVVANRFNNDVMAFLGDGTGRLFPDSLRYGSGNGPFNMSCADFNEDFRIDLATVNFTGNTISVLLNNYPIADALATLETSDVPVSATITWSPIPGASSYRVYRGRLALLDSDNYGQCLAFGLTAPEYTDPDGLLPGDGFFYLVSAVTNGNEGPLGYSSTCVSRPNFHPCFEP